MTDREQICKRIAELEKFIRTESNRLELIKGNFKKWRDAATDPDIVKRVDFHARPDVAVIFQESVADQYKTLAEAQQELYELRELIYPDVEKIVKDSPRNIILYRYIFGMTAQETADKLFYADSRSVSRVCTQFMRYQI